MSHTSEMSIRIRQASILTNFIQRYARAVQRTAASADAEPHAASARRKEAARHLPHHKKNIDTLRADIQALVGGAEFEELSKISQAALRGNLSLISIAGSPCL